MDDDARDGTDDGTASDGTSSDGTEDARSNALAAVFFAVGVGTLAPWNVFITARPYFAARFATSNERAVEASFEAAFASAYSVSNLVVSWAVWRSRLVEGRRDGTRLTGPLFVVGLALWTCGATTRIDASPDFVFAETLLIIAFVGGLTAIAQSGGFAAASALPAAYAQAMMSGQAASGVAVSLVAMMTTAGMGETMKANERHAEAYFYVATVTLFACAWATTRLAKIPMYRRRQEEAREAEAHADTARAETRTLLGGDEDEIEGDSVEDVERNDETSASFDAKEECRLYRLTVVTTFVATLCVFPAVTSAIESTSGTFGALWSPTLFLLFNLGDLLGRHLASIHPKTPPSGRSLLQAATLRFAFVPLIAVCNVSTSGWRAPKVFTTDVFPLFFITSLAVTNGWTASVAMMHGASRAHPSEREAEGVVLNFCLVAGIFAGTTLSLVFSSV